MPQAPPVRETKYVETLIPPAERELKELVIGYKGFGMISLIVTLASSKKLWMPHLLLAMCLLVGQWAGPVGFAAAEARQVQTTMQGFCPG